jgi:hypothetical protein
LLEESKSLLLLISEIFVILHKTVIIPGMNNMPIIINLSLRLELGIGLNSLAWRKCQHVERCLIGVIFGVFIPKGRLVILDLRDELAPNGIDKWNTHRTSDVGQDGLYLLIRLGGQG